MNMLSVDSSDEKAKKLKIKGTSIAGGVAMTDDKSEGMDKTGQSKAQKELTVIAP